MDVDGMPYWGKIAWPVPCGAYAKCLTKRNKLARRCYSANLADVDAYIINQSFRNQPCPFIWVIE